MQEIILFVLCFFIVLFVYEVFIVKKAKRKNSKKQPIEVRYLVSKYKVDLKKANYKQMLQMVALVSSFDIALIVSISSIGKSYLIQLLIAVILMIPVILLSYHFVGKFYEKKGLIKDE